MPTFILVLTLVTYRGMAIESIPGFVSRSECEAAAVQWRQALEKLPGEVEGYHKSATCLEQKAIK